MKKASFIDPNSSVPIFQQIVTALEHQILNESLKDGDFLMSVREFAVQHHVNPNTVAKAYQQLQVMDLVESIRGLGLKVRAMDGKTSQKKRNKLLEEKIDECVELAKTLQISSSEFLDLVKGRIKK